MARYILNQRGLVVPILKNDFIVSLLNENAQGSDRELAIYTLCITSLIIQIEYILPLKGDSGGQIEEIHEK